VPSVIQAATSIFASHDVRQIAQADASNLRKAASHVVDLLDWAKRSDKRALIFLTGVPGFGKTLAGLQAVDDAIATGHEQQGGIAYLSGNTPLITVLRESFGPQRVFKVPRDQANKISTGDSARSSSENPLAPDVAKPKAHAKRPPRWRLRSNAPASVDPSGREVGDTWNLPESAVEMRFPFPMLNAARTRLLRAARAFSLSGE
jgi:hypothetical protein